MKSKLFYCKKKLKMFFCFFVFFTLPITAYSQCWLAVETGFSRTIAIKSDGTLWVWGSDDSGTLGLGPTVVSQCTPAQIGNDTNWVAISAANHYCLAIKSDGTLWAWGKHLYGNTGILTTNNIFTPTQVGTDTNWKSISAGQRLAMGIKTDGTLWGWSSFVPNGIPLSGISQKTPMQLGNENDWKEVSCGYDHNMALKNNNTLWTCGKNFNGQLGNGSSGTNLEQNSFIQIGTESNWKSISAGQRFSLATKNNGTLWGWGKNNYYQVGDGTNIQRTIPTQIGNETNWQKVEAGNENAFAIKTNYSLHGWGRNSTGNLGLGNTAQRTIPTQIGNNTNWDFISALDSHSIALKNDGSLWGAGYNFHGGVGITNGTFGTYNPVINFSQIKCQTAFIANDDIGTSLFGTSASPISNVLSNDLTYGNQANTSNVELSFISSTNSGITLNTITGAINVSSTVPIGTYTLTYGICDPNEVYCNICGDVGIVTINVISCTYSPIFDLVIKDSQNDTGVQPNTVTLYPWASTDIWIRNQPDGIDDHQNPEYSTTEPNYVNVRVKNNSCITSSGNDVLKVYWAKAGTGLNWPSVWNGSLTFSNNALQGSPIGSINIPILQPGQEAILQLDFLVPNPNDYVAVSGPDAWHFCLLARIESLNDPMISETSDLVSNVLNNNNIAWKNITIVDLLPNALGGINDGGVIAVGSLDHQPKEIFLEFVEDINNEKPIYEEAEVTVKMDEIVYNAWVRGGKKSTFLKDTKENNIKIVTDNHALLDGLIFDENEVGTVVVKFNFLTEELSDKTRFDYNVIQKETETGKIIGGESYVVKKHNRSMFYANGGNNLEVDKNEPITISAEQISEPAIYNWYDSAGNLVYTGLDLSISPEVSEKYKLEVIAISDGFKDYSEIDVRIKPSSLSAIAPNPAIDTVTFSYKLNEVNSAYLMVIGEYGTNGMSNNYILNLNSTETTVNLSNYSSGFYTVALVCDGEIVDAKTMYKL